MQGMIQTLDSELTKAKHAIESYEQNDTNLRAQLDESLNRSSKYESELQELKVGGKYIFILGFFFSLSYSPSI
jgi:chromosome segregation ATPase